MTVADAPIPKRFRAAAYLRTAKRLRSYSAVEGICLVPAGLLGDAAGYLELAAHEAEQDASAPGAAAGEDRRGT